MKIITVIEKTIAHYLLPLLAIFAIVVALDTAHVGVAIGALVISLSYVVALPMMSLFYLADWLVSMTGMSQATALVLVWPVGGFLLSIAVGLLLSYRKRRTLDSITNGL